MFRRIDDFLTSFDYERSKTLAVLDAIPDGKMGQAIANDHRTLARLGWHLAATCVEMPASMGLPVDVASGAPATPEDPVPATMAAIRSAYAAVSASLADKVRALPDADLLVETPMYGESWKKGYTLYALLLHQAHHRGQMSVLMRQAGLRPPEVYGPAKEDWAAFGQEAPKV